MLRHGRLTLLAWGVGLLLSLWIVTMPEVELAYHSPRLRLAQSTVDVGVAVLVAYLTHLRFVRRQVVGDLLLAHALLILAIANAYDGVMQLSVGDPSTDVWITSSLRVLGSVLLLTAALVPMERRARVGIARWTAIGPLLVLAVFAGLAVVLGPLLPVPIGSSDAEVQAEPELLTAHPALIGGHLASAFCFLVASVVFTALAARYRDELLRWLGAACALGGFARVAYALSPSVYTDWLYAGDLLRTGSYLVLLLGSARELSLYWTEREVQAVEEDRRRLARELHDGVVQELSYIRGEAHSIPDETLRGQVLGATDRALDEARAAIHALGHLGTEPLADLLHQTAHELGRRHQLAVEVDADETVAVDPQHHHTILRIVREAVTNAARHGRATQVSIELAHDGEARLVRVRDDGSGFDPRSAARMSAGYGMISMAERARSLPGTLHIDSEPGQGCEVRVRW